MLPAYAGMIPSGCALHMLSAGAPRVCGDDPATMRTPSPASTVLPAYAGMIPRRWPVRA